MAWRTTFQGIALCSRPWPRHGPWLDFSELFVTLFVASAQCQALESWLESWLEHLANQVDVAAREGVHPHDPAKAEVLRGQKSRPQCLLRPFLVCNGTSLDQTSPCREVSWLLVFTVATQRNSRQRHMPQLTEDACLDTASDLGVWALLLNFMSPAM